MCLFLTRLDNRLITAKATLNSTFFVVNHTYLREKYVPRLLGHLSAKSPLINETVDITPISVSCCIAGEYSGFVQKQTIVNFSLNFIFLAQLMNFSKNYFLAISTQGNEKRVHPICSNLRIHLHK